MRIALVAHTRSRSGGTETYIEQLAAGLRTAGHAVALWYERRDTDRPLIDLPGDAPAWSVQDLGIDRALRALRDWQPTVLFSHSVSTPEVETALLESGPAVQFVHAYHGACISGSKSRLSPLRMPCDRPLGKPCLLHYFPRRCGGWNPGTMVRRYTIETRRRDLLGRYAAILTASSHMRREYLRYGLPPSRVVNVGLMIPARGLPSNATTSRAGLTPIRPSGRDLTRERRLLFVGRLTDLKGGPLLLRALVHLRESFRGKLVLTFAGDGPERETLQARAAAMQSTINDLEIRFPGWLDPDDVAREMRDADVLVVPSIWPEPFGLVGPEAGLHGLPAVAFAVGGIPDWLSEGVNGHLAPGDPPTARGLGEAIQRCFADSAHHAALQAGARTAALELSADRHVSRIVEVLAGAVSNPLAHRPS